MAKKGKQKVDHSPRLLNRRARHDYFLSDFIECGMALLGSEVKALRAGQGNLGEAFARISPRGELELHNFHIDPYRKSGIAYQHEPLRTKKLLVHKREIRKLDEATREKGTSLIPTSVYWKGGRAKVELAVAKGKKEHDKRETLKRKVQDREIRRAMTVKQ
ncbi:MAG: SsrA-binding protein SmpB [Planctomycetota bacterium]